MRADRKGSDLAPDQLGRFLAALTQSILQSERPQKHHGARRKTAKDKTIPSQGLSARPMVRRIVSGGMYRLYRMCVLSGWLGFYGFARRRLAQLRQKAHAPTFSLMGRRRRPASRESSTTRAISRYWRATPTGFLLAILPTACGFANAATDGPARMCRLKRMTAAPPGRPSPSPSSALPARSACPASVSW